MGKSSDKGHRENKKPKKDAKRISPVIDIIAPPVEVQVIKTKGKKLKFGEEE